MDGHGIGSAHSSASNGARHGWVEARQPSLERGTSGFAYNGAIEADARLQAEAIERGIKVSRYADPLLTPVLLAVHGWVLLDDDGGFTTVEERAA